MATQVQICNTALGFLGDLTQVTSIYPSDGSYQANLCNAFYAPAVAAILTMPDANWGFATMRTALTTTASSGTLWNAWQYTYAMPSDCVKALEVFSPDAMDDYSQALQSAYTYDMTPIGQGYGIYTPQPFVIENDGSGNQIIYTNQETALLRYISNNVIEGLFPPFFTMALAYYLAHMLAGPILKGDEGLSASAKMLELMQQQIAYGAVVDANQKFTRVHQNVPWVVQR